MIDFHSHILPKVDDGSQSMEESLEMLRRSLRQDVDTVFLTSHFYAFEDNLESFLQRRDSAYAALIKTIHDYPEPMPRIFRGAEVLYFPGMCDANEIACLALENTKCLLVEPPWDEWTSDMLDEIEETGKRLRLIPVIAHIDRYMYMFDDFSLAEQVFSRRMLAQVNANFLFSPDSFAFAMKLMCSGRFQLIGSDAHNLESRPPNIGKAIRRITDAGFAGTLETFDKKSRSLLKG